MTITGNKFKVKVNTSDVVMTLKNKIFEVTGVTADTQTVIYTGKAMENQKRIQDYRVKDGKGILISCTRCPRARTTVDGLPIALEEGGERSCAASPDPSRALGWATQSTVV